MNKLTIKAKKTSTRRWFDSLSEDHQESFYQYLESFPTHELWDVVIDHLPKPEAEKILAEWTGGDEEPYRKNKKKARNTK